MSKFEEITKPTSACTCAQKETAKKLTWISTIDKQFKEKGLKNLFSNGTSEVGQDSVLGKNISALMAE